MKYIRTKHNIYKVENTYEHLGKTYYFIATFGKKDIINQADTIEELCDEFVIIYNKSKRFKKPFASAHDNLKDLLEEHELSKCKVYGAIWTDKGLIYVAKMNDKGELELL